MALLLAHGAPVNARDKEGRTAAFGALHQMPPGAVIKQLLAAGAQPDVVNACGETPLSVALGAGQQGCAQALLEGGAAVHAGALTQALRVPDLRGEWMLALLPSRSISSEQLAEWAEAGFGGRARHMAEMPFLTLMNSAGWEEQPSSSWCGRCGRCAAGCRRSCCGW